MRNSGGSARWAGSPARSEPAIRRRALARCLEARCSSWKEQPTGTAGPAQTHIVTLVGRVRRTRQHRAAKEERRVRFASLPWDTPQPSRFTSSQVPRDKEAARQVDATLSSERGTRRRGVDNVMGRGRLAIPKHNSCRRDCAQPVPVTLKCMTQRTSSLTNSNPSNSTVATSAPRTPSETHRVETMRPVSLPHWFATTGPQVTRPTPPCSERSTTLPRRAPRSTTLACRSADADFTKSVAPAPQARPHELYLDTTLLTIPQATHPSRARPGCPAGTTSPPSSAGMWALSKRAYLTFAPLSIPSSAGTRILR